MAMVKKNREHAEYASLYGEQARKDGKEREVSELWQKYAEAWLQASRTFLCFSSRR